MTAAMADGSVRGISFTISDAMFSNLCNKQDGNTVTLD